MGRPCRMLAKGAVIAAASLCVAAALPGCSASGSASSSAAGSPKPTTAHSTAHPAKAAFAFTVAGDRPVLPGGKPGHARANAERPV